MIPLRDDNPTRRFPFVTVLLIVANLAIFLYEASLSDAALNAFIATWGLVPARLLAHPGDAGQLTTLLTSMFLHGGWLHVLGNMLYLWIFGNNIEDRLGHVGFTLFYLAAGVAAAFAQVAASGSVDIPTIGASGAIAGILGAYLVLYPGAAVVTLIPIFFFIEVARVPAFLVIGFWFLLQLGNGVASLGDISSGGVAWFAHIGGFALGLVVAALVALWERAQRPRYRSSWR
ncbi:MAG TPA: rhomboid family intramembrane serine protease [Coriobacteriia bacterium]|nr:rhomboid family intramembrane serine protease [Coriobacteriia bacterium]